VAVRHGIASWFEQIRPLSRTRRQHQVN
jgi:hypothetical protein